jgi:hypothetical protein
MVSLKKPNICLPKIVSETTKLQQKESAASSVSWE